MPTKPMETKLLSSYKPTLDGAFSGREAGGQRSRFVAFVPVALFPSLSAVLRFQTTSVLSLHFYRPQATAREMAEGRKAGMLRGAGGSRQASGPHTSALRVPARQRRQQGYTVLRRNRTVPEDCALC